MSDLIRESVNASNFCSGFQLYLLHNHSWGFWSKDTLLISSLKHHILLLYDCYFLLTKYKKGERCYCVSFPPFWLVPHRWANKTRFLIIYILIYGSQLLIFFHHRLKVSIHRSILDSWHYEWHVIVLLFQKGSSK